jgi:hypothetical protein
MALAAMVVVIGSAFREARGAAGIGLLAAVGRSFKTLERFVFWFC